MGVAAVSYSQPEGARGSSLHDCKRVVSRQAPDLSYGNVAERFSDDLLALPGMQLGQHPARSVWEDSVSVVRWVPSERFQTSIRDPFVS